MRVDSIDSMSSIQKVASSLGKHNTTKDEIIGKQEESSCELIQSQDLEVTQEAVIGAIEKANKKIEVYDTRLEFSIHEKTNEIMIKVIKDDEVIREIPPEKILDMVAKMMEMAGILVDEKA